MVVVDWDLQVLRNMMEQYFTHIKECAKVLVDWHQLKVLKQNKVGELITIVKHLNCIKGGNFPCANIAWFNNSEISCEDDVMATKVTHTSPTLDSQQIQGTNQCVEVPKGFRGASCEGYFYY